LFLEHLGELLRVNKADTEAMMLAARWLGAFHAANELTNGDEAPGFLKRYDSNYFAGWADRTARFVRDVAALAPWVAEICGAFKAHVPALLAAPQMVVHGEYVVKNVLFRGGVVYPTDWESAAVGPGDLAALTDLWSDEIALQCEREYEQARWPGGAPETFPRILAIARLYWPLRWLGDRAAWTRPGNHHYFEYFEVLHRAGRRLGLLSR